MGARLSAAWFASSRVGTRTRARGRLGAARRVRSIVGSPKASVLPEPVGALPQISRPSSAGPMVSVWMGNGVVMPDALRAPATSWERPSSMNPPVFASEASTEGEEGACLRATGGATTGSIGAAWRGARAGGRREGRGRAVAGVAAAALVDAGALRAARGRSGFLGARVNSGLLLRVWV